MEFVVTGACAGVDVLGGWWDDRLRHTVRVLYNECLFLSELRPCRRSPPLYATVLR